MKEFRLCIRSSRNNPVLCWGAAECFSAIIFLGIFLSNYIPAIMFSWYSESVLFFFLNKCIQSLLLYPWLHFSPNRKCFLKHLQYSELPALLNTKTLPCHISSLLLGPQRSGASSQEILNNISLSCKSLLHSYSSSLTFSSALSCPCQSHAYKRRIMCGIT